MARITKFCPCCWYRLEEQDWNGDRYHCPACGLEGNSKQVLGTPYMNVWENGYDEELLEKLGFGIMTYPECLELVGHDGFIDNVWAIDDDEGKALYGRYAYVYRKEWKRNLS